MDFLISISSFYTVKFCFYFFIILFCLTPLLALPKKLKNSLARKLINDFSERSFLNINIFLFLISTLLALFLSLCLMKDMKIAPKSQFALIFSTIELARFAFIAFYNKWLFSFVAFKEWLYNYLQK
ncbi:MAG: hypothetical protein R3Y09_06155 [Clostridia bacterium]